MMHFWLPQLLEQVYMNVNNALTYMVHHLINKDHFSKQQNSVCEFDWRVRRIVAKDPFGS